MEERKDCDSAMYIGFYVVLGFLLVIVTGIGFICDISMFGRSGCMKDQIPRQPHTHVILKLSEASSVRPQA